MMSRWWALVSFEIRQQLRDPLTALYAIIFALLFIGFMSSGAVELVGDRNGVPKTSPWSLALAFGGLTAFGQVITTMVVATALLRDTAMRTDALLITSDISARLWYSARMTAAIAVLGLVYLAMPIGALLGATIAQFVHGDNATSIVTQCIGLCVTLMRTWLVITLPTCLVVAALLGAAAVFTQRILAVLAVALLLVALWQLTLGLEAKGNTRQLGALLDPFANAPVLAMTRAWSADARALRAITLVDALGWNRLLWITIAVSGIAVTAYFAQWPSAAPAVNHDETERESEHDFASAKNGGSVRWNVLANIRTPQSLPSRAFRAARGTNQTPYYALTQLTSTWMQRDGGWRVVAILAALNAIANAWSRSTSTSTAAEILGLIAEHSRLFLILLATVYAGEVLWREREVRIDALCDSTPVSTRTLAIGRLSGLYRAQLSVVLAITCSAAVVLIARALGSPRIADGSPSLVTLFPAWIVFALWLPFAQLTALSVFVHAIVNHKVLAHLLLISGWVTAVVLDRNGAAAWWYRFAESAPLVARGQINFTTMALHASWWSAISMLLLGVAVARWPRGQPGTTTSPR